MSVIIFIGGQQLVGYTSMSLSRNKEDLTGQLSIEVFMNWMPDKPVLGEVTKGQEVSVYIGGHLVFYGDIDRRTDSGTSEQPRDSQGRFMPGPSGGSGSSMSIGPTQYTVTLSCRGKAGKLVDSSHQHETGTMLRTTNRAAMEKLVEPWGIEIEWLAEEIQVERVRFRDGSRVLDEIVRLAEQFSLYVFETRDGRLKVLDKADTLTGEPILLGTNILSFSTDQAADQERSEVLVKGQLTGPAQWGEDAVLPTLRKIQDQTLNSFVPATVQLYGNAVPGQLERRAYYELNRRAAEGKQINVEVFHVQQTDGEPWDIGKLHYVEIPPAGVFGQFETTAVAYKVDAGGTLKTTLTLSPKPAAAPEASGNNVLDSLPALPIGFDIDVAARIARFGVSGLVSSWSSPDLIQLALQNLAGQGFAQILEEVQASIGKPALRLPPGFKGVEQ